jgi:hypothetical protein
MKLSVGARKDLFQVLMDAYPSSASLAVVLTLMDKNIEDLTNVSGERPSKYLDVIMNAEARNWVDDLIGALWDHQEGNDPVRTNLEKIAGRIKQEQAASARPMNTHKLFDHAYSDEADQKLEDALQRTVRRGQPDEEVVRFFNRILNVSKAVCSVEWSHEHQGTGFLIAPRTLITNRHVIAPMNGHPSGEFTARFGFERGEGAIIRDGFRTGFENDWLVFSRPHDPVDETERPNAPPRPENLDYAIVRLKDQPDGIEPVALDEIGTTAKGNDILLIQHPAGAPKKVSFGRITEIAGEDRRQRYDANTKAGSSGSPVLDHTGRLVGLHHAGDPNFERLATYNQAIPLSLIKADMDANNVEVI